ncbi:MAG: aspartate-semialdehyde dehydrogenase [Elusimicrobiota bacterium]
MSLRVAVVGATGMVGRILLATLQARRFPVGALLPFSSGRSDASVRFRGRLLRAPAPASKLLRSADLVFMVSSDEVSLRYGRRLAAAGVWVIDDSSAFRMAPDVPLVIPEVNASSLSARSRLIAGPNCTLTGLAVAGYPLHSRAGIREVRLASYQAVSGAGRESLLELYSQLRRCSRALRPEEPLPALPRLASRALPRPIAFNVFPQVGSFDENGDCAEERKVRAELRKIWRAPALKVSATAVRVPTLRGHSLAVWLKTARRLAPAAAKKLLSRAAGVHLWPEGSYPTPLSAAGTAPVHVARVRSSGIGEELALWIVSDNLLKGAALNSVQIAEHLLKKGWLRKRSCP